MSSPKSPKSALTKIGFSRRKPIRVLVLGQSGVGKSALVVRFITRRFIGDYAPFLERIYTHATVIDGESVSFEILDSAGNAYEHEEESVRLETNIRWADVYILMYSVTDKCSFDDCNRIKFLINYNKRKKKLASPTSKDGSSDVPVVLVGNKYEQVEDRMVTFQEGIKRSRDIGCHSFHEISVRESIEEVYRVFTDAVHKWKNINKIPKLRRTSSELQRSPELCDDSKCLHLPINVPGLPLTPLHFEAAYLEELEAELEHQNLPDADQVNPKEAHLTRLVFGLQQKSPSVMDKKDGSSSTDCSSSGSSGEGFFGSIRFAFGGIRKASNEERRFSSSVSPPEPDMLSLPYRNRSCTDGQIHQKSLMRIKMNIHRGESFLLHRRMSIAMRGSTCGFLKKE